MPQGGIDEGEDPYKAALRELYEETNITLGREARRDRRLARLRSCRATSSHDAWGGKYRGQKQKWYALRFTGDDSEINVTLPAGGHHPPEFIDWRWVEMRDLPDLVVPFKRDLYERVVKEFAMFVAA